MFSLLVMFIKRKVSNWGSSSLDVFPILFYNKAWTFSHSEATGIPRISITRGQQYDFSG